MRQYIVTVLRGLTLISILLSIGAKAAVSPSLLIRAASDGIYHGSSETSGQPIIAVNSEIQINNYWTAGVQLQDSEPLKARQRQRNLSAYIGYDKKINNAWLSSTYYTHRAFLNAEREWDYDEFTTRLFHQNGSSFGVFYAPNYYSSSVKAIGANVQYTGILIKNSYWRTQIGHVNIPSLFNYQYAELTIGTSIKRFNVELGYHWTSDTLLSTPVGNIDSPKVTLSINCVAF